MKFTFDKDFSDRAKTRNEALVGFEYRGRWKLIIQRAIGDPDVAEAIAVLMSRILSSHWKGKQELLLEKLRKASEDFNADPKP